MNQNNYDEICDTTMPKPHVVILGAGASLAAFPNGDANGKYLPLMDNLIDVLNLIPLFETNKLDYKHLNFELLYSNLAKEQKFQILQTLETKIYEYFSSLVLPDNPTLYDHLVMSLRKKDIIATFNWDPFLYDACMRNHSKMSLPKVFFLHGNVRIGYCSKHRIKGNVNGWCPECGKKLLASKLLYPIENKNYNDNDFISSEWEAIKFYMSNAYCITVFGYSAPKTGERCQIDRYML